MRRCRYAIACREVIPIRAAVEVGDTFKDGCKRLVSEFPDLFVKTLYHALGGGVIVCYLKDATSYAVDMHRPPTQTGIVR